MGKAYQAKIFWDGQLMEELTLLPMDQTNTIFTLRGNQYSVYMSVADKKEFKQMRDAAFNSEMALGRIQEISKDDMYKMIQSVLFASGNESGLVENMEKYGVYHFSTRYSLIPTIYKWNRKVECPMIFYNANDGSWVVACGG